MPRKTRTKKKVGATAAPVATTDAVAVTKKRAAADSVDTGAAMPKRVKQTEPNAEVEDDAVEEIPSVFVSGIPYEATEDDIQSFFVPAGTAVAVRMPRYHDSGKPRGYAHVDFATLAEAKAACAMDGQVLKTRYLDISMSRGIKPRTPLKSAAAPGLKSKSVFVGNLPYEADESQLTALFEGCGEISQVRIGIDSGTQRTKGFAYIDFATQEGADQAIEMTDAQLNGRLLRVDYDIGRKKNSYKGRKPGQ